MVYRFRLDFLNYVHISLVIYVKMSFRISYPYSFHTIQTQKKVLPCILSNYRLHVIESTLDSMLAGEISFSSTYLQSLFRVPPFLMFEEMSMTSSMVAVQYWANAETNLWKIHNLSETLRLLSSWKNSSLFAFRVINRTTIERFVPFSSNPITLSACITPHINLLLKTCTFFCPNTD